MHLPEKPPIRDRAHDILNAFESHFRIGNIVYKEEETGDHLNGKENQSNKSKGIKNIDILGYPVLGQMGLHEIIQPNSYFQPVLYFPPHLLIRSE
jgi:hypothetical protein